MLTFRIASAKTQKKTQLLSQPFIPNKLKARDTTTKRQEEPVQENDTNQKMNKKKCRTQFGNLAFEIKNEKILEALERSRGKLNKKKKPKIKQQTNNIKQQRPGIKHKRKKKVT